MPENQAGSFFLEMEEIEFFAEAAMVAFFCLFQHVEVSSHIVFLSPGGTVDSLQHFVLAVTSPVSAGKFHQLVNSQATGARDVGSAAKVDIVTLTVQRNGFTGRDRADDFGLVVFADGVEIFNGLVAVHLFTNNRKIAFNDLVHLLFDERKIFVGQMFRQREVVVKTVFNHRSDRDLSLRVQLFDSLSHQVRGRMTNDLKALRVFVSHNRNRTVFGNRVRQVHEFAVNFTCQSSASEAGADRGCNVTYGNR